MLTDKDARGLAVVIPGELAYRLVFWLDEMAYDSLSFGEQRVKEQLLELKRALAYRVLCGELNDEFPGDE